MDIFLGLEEIVANRFYLIAIYTPHTSMEEMRFGDSLTHACFGVVSFELFPAPDNSSCHSAGIEDTMVYNYESEFIYMAKYFLNLR